MSRTEPGIESVPQKPPPNSINGNVTCSEEDKNTAGCGRFTSRLATLAISCCLACGSAESSGAAPVRDPLPPQGLYEGCPPATELESCIGRLEHMQRAGFRRVLNYSSWYSSSQNIVEYADAAQELDMKLIWPLNHEAWRNPSGLAQTYSQLGKEWGNPANDEFITKAIDLVKDHPATWGFYIGDEVPRQELNQVENLSSTVRSLAPSSQQLYIGRPGARALKPFVDTASTIGADVYPVGSKDPLVWKVARRTQQVADKNNKRVAMVLQAFSWSQYDSERSSAFPTFSQMRKMRNAALRFSDPQMILWYSYQDIQRSQAPVRHWNSLAKAAFSPFKQDQNNRQPTLVIPSVAESKLAPSG